MIFDPRPERVLSASKLQSRAGYSPYEGLTVKGKVKMTICRGEIVYRDGEVVDGAYGAVAALEVLRTLVDSGDPAADRVEVVGFADEEGVRFGFGLIGSLALAGELEVDKLRNGTDWQGKLAADVLAAAGVDVDRMLDAHQHLEQVARFLELHIEQARMEADGVDLAVVTGIVGVHREHIRVRGEQNHAGTTPFTHRKDAGRAAARAVASVREVVQSGATTLSPTSASFASTLAASMSFPGSPSSISKSGTLKRM